MSKGLEALNKPYGVNIPCDKSENEYTYTETQKQIIEKELKEGEMWKAKYTMLEKEHIEVMLEKGALKKALEIIKNKITNKDSSKVFYPFYQDLKGDFHIVLTQEEYNLLKEILL